VTRPAYLSLSPRELADRAEQALGQLAACRLCPRECGADRLADKWGACKTGRHAVVTSFFPHTGEERCLSGRRGSGTIFLGHCNLRCVFCQNSDISQGLKPGGQTSGVRPQTIAAMMLQLQEEGCHNINFVTPEHVVPQVLEALALAAANGLSLPVVYNTSAYDSLESLRLLDGVVDVYMPDFKLWSPAACRRYLMAGDYAEHARAAIAEMHRQVGTLQLDADGLATRGVLLRHLVMPGLLEETRAILGWIAREVSPDTFVNLMDQYRPANRVAGGRFPEIARRPSRAEIAEAYRVAREVGLHRFAAEGPQ